MADAPKDVFPTEFKSGGRTPTERLDWDDLAAIPFSVEAELGRCTLQVRDILSLRKGSVVPLNKAAGELTDLCCNGVPFARGEIVVVGDVLNIRIVEIFGLAQRELLENE